MMLPNGEVYGGAAFIPGYGNFGSLVQFNPGAIGEAEQGSGVFGRPHAFVLADFGARGECGERGCFDPIQFSAHEFHGGAGAGEPAGTGKLPVAEIADSRDKHHSGRNRPLRGEPAYGLPLSQFNGNTRAVADFSENPSAMDAFPEVHLDEHAPAGVERPGEVRRNQRSKVRAAFDGTRRGGRWEQTCFHAGGGFRGGGRLRFRFPDFFQQTIQTHPRPPDFRISFCSCLRALCRVTATTICETPNISAISGFS